MNETIGIILKENLNNNIKYINELQRLPTKISRDNTKKLKFKIVTKKNISSVTVEINGELIEWGHLKMKMKTMITRRTSQLQLS